MARKNKSPKGAGRRVNIWIPERYLKLWDSFENNSKFVQICLQDPIGIMQWAIMRERDPKRYPDVNEGKPVEPVLEKFNAIFPLDPMTAARKKKEAEKCENSPSKPELW